MAPKRASRGASSRKRKASEGSTKVSPKLARKGEKKEQKAKESKLPVVVMAGSAGGRPPKAIKEMLEKLTTVIYAPESGKWKSWSPAGPNQTALQSAVQTAISMASKGDENRGVVIASSSFGCRVAAQFWADRDQSIDKAVQRKLVCFGYPLFRPKPGQDRVAVLKQLPKDLRVLMISGNRDEFLHRNYQDLPKGTKAFSSLAKECTASMRLHSTNGKHNPLDGAKKAERNDVSEVFRGFLLEREQEK